ncbi:MAG: hypothetical protein LBU38_04505 [Propionibacteriaceae bacterium]|nr:hypothetical protein [Propionibacteriaceae bacterium]
MSLLERLDDEAVWHEFAEHKRSKAALSKRADAQLNDFLAARSWEPVVAAIAAGESFGIPEKRLINKMSSGKKRVVYTFEPSQTWVLKLLAYLLYEYDGRQPAGCYSFRRGQGAHQAIRDLIHTRGISSLWSFKADISDYFNSIDIPTLLPQLELLLHDDPPLFRFLAALLGNPQVRTGDSIIEEPHGVMAGIPIAPFLANLYLAELDEHFTGLGVPYARYSDDIIFFASSQAQLAQYRSYLDAVLARRKLFLNPNKVSISAPGEPWEYLGFGFTDGQIDLSTATRKKLKGKISRRARAIRRWMLRKEAEPERAVRAMIRTFNRKFFESDANRELTWSRWFFPLLTRADSLHEIDAYLQRYLRYIPTGRHSDANYSLRYPKLKALGYRSLAHEYFRFTSERARHSPAPSRA